MARGQTENGVNCSLFGGAYKARVAGGQKGCSWYFRRPFLVHFLGEQKMNMKTAGVWGNAPYFLTSGNFQSLHLKTIIILQILMERTKLFPDNRYLPCIQIPECGIPLDGGGKLFQF